MNNLVYEIPFWDNHQWHRFVELTSEAQDAIATGQKKIFSFPQLGTEVFSRLYSLDLELLDKPKPEAAWAAKLHEELSQNEQFQDLQALVNGNYYLSGLAATSFLTELARAMPVPEERVPDPQELRLQVLGQKRRGEQGDQELIAQLIGQGKLAVAAAQDYADDLDKQITGVISRAARTASEQLQEATTNLEAFDWRLEGGQSGVGGSIEEKVNLAKRISSSKKLGAIAAQAGRLKRIAALKQLSQTKQARHTIESVECGNDLERILPSQVLTLTVPSLKPLFVKGYAEKTLLQYKMGGKDRMGRGPLVVVLDSTGSMRGSREIWSKAVTLALLGIASQQKRHCRVIHYGNGARRVDDFPPKEKDNRKLLASMEYFYDDAVNWEPDAIDSAVECIEKHKHYKDADIVFITDGGWGVGSGRSREDSSRWAKKFAAAKRRLGFSVYTILIEHDSKSAIEKYIKPDKLIDLKTLAQDEAIAEVFSI